MFYRSGIFGQKRIFCHFYVILLMEQITTKTPIPRCWLFLKNWPVNGPCGRCSSVCGPLGWSTNFEGSESDQIQCTSITGTPTKRQVSKRLKHQVCKTSGLQNVRFTKPQVFKTPSCKKTSIYILYLWFVEIRRFCCSHVCRQSDGCVLLYFRGFFCHISP
jgi:hypothetical protein